MRIKELINRFEQDYPLETSEDWDNSGVQVGDVNQELKNVMVTLEITAEALTKAVEEDVNLIICHHPLIFPTISNIDKDNFKGSKLINAIKNNIVIYASHSSTDMAGFNEYIFNRLGFQSEGKILYTNESKTLAYGDFANKEISLRPLVEQIKENLDLDNIVVWGDKNKFSKIGLVTGSGMSFIEDVKKLGIDLFITGDIGHHDAMDAIEQGITLIDISHEGSEKFFTYFVERILDEEFEDGQINVIKYYNEDKYLRKIM
ncbi:Nif3-like dinuclear metal center hexameric protein [uncultured Helcococcus sp.]|uniref:Nif3-like dinuclear metal center hexameric protein n=1 Tax=uncultured Helcococcus sp. TaxID=1072508 RepID=UPI0026162828|nr:Nif3-like dinuclear metal center hexameric protein [uncultured Helcococcus sp.]